MLIQRLLPDILKELMKHVPSLAFELMDWGSVMRDVPVITQRRLTQAGVNELKNSHFKQCQDYLSFDPCSEKEQNPQMKGDLLLKYYFDQFYNPDGVFFDLRPQHFSLFQDKLHFQPNGLWFKFSNPFQRGILDLYEGFYLNDSQKFQSGLLATGLMKTDWPEEDQMEITQLLTSHFGPNRENPMEFKVRTFQESFLKIFQFLMKKKTKISSEFMVFGILIVTLYLSLEAHDSRHLVQEIFKIVHSKNKASS